jgi:hypothetical protein
VTSENSDAAMTERVIFKVQFNGVVQGVHEMFLLDCHCSAVPLEYFLLSQLRSSIYTLAKEARVVYSEDFKLVWVDAEGDSVAIRSDEDLLLALKIVTTRKTKWRPEVYVMKLRVY